MNKFTREELKQIADTDHVQCGEASALACMALAAMDSEPVGEVIERPCSGEMNTDMTYRRVKGLGEMESMPVGTKFYAAQPVPVVHEALEHLHSIVADPRLLPRRKEWIGGQQYSYVLLEEVEAIVDDACRAAMLNGGKS